MDFKLKNVNVYLLNEYIVWALREAHNAFYLNIGYLLSNSTKLFRDEAKPKCDLFSGEWVPYPSGSVYNNNSCPFIEQPQNCMSNGRPDSDYLYWRWNPLDCKLAKFDPERFLDSMRNKSWGFIGDSISRNHVQSFLCILSQVYGFVLCGTFVCTLMVKNLNLCDPLFWLAYYLLLIGA